MRSANGGPAFPVPGLQHDEDFNGMTLRDYFAAKALLALLGDSENYGTAVRTADKKGVDASVFIASAAYEMADAMLTERAK